MCFVTLCFAVWQNNQLVATEVHDAEILTLEIYGLDFISVLKSNSNAERLLFDATQDGDLFAASFVRLEQAVAECLRTLKYPSKGLLKSSTLADRIF